MRNYKKIIISLFVFFMIIVFWLVHCFTGGAQVKTESKNTTHIKGQQTSSIAFINSDIWDGRKVAQNIKILDEEINDLSASHESRQKKIEQLAEQFLRLEMDVEKFVQDRSTDDAFVLYLRALTSRIQQYGGSEDDAVEFFFAGLQKYKTICLMDIPDVARLDDKSLLKWDEALQWLRGSMCNNLNNIKRHLFDSYLIGISEELRPNVRVRFSKYYTHTTQEVARVELEHRRQRDNQARSRRSGLTGLPARIYDAAQRDALPKEEE